LTGRQRGLATAETASRGPLHPLRATAPVTGRDTRSEGVHCLQIGCSTASHKNKRGICETQAWLRCPRWFRDQRGHRMQFKNTTDAASQTDTNQHNVGEELHAKLLWPGRRRSLASLRDDAPSHPSAHRAALMWRAPEGPEGLAGLRGDVQAHISDPAPQVWRAPEGLMGLAAAPVGGGGAWPGFETTRRARTIGHERGA